MTTGDPANGYDALADAFIAGRARSSIGVATVRAWARSLPSGASILDLGCGSGEPLARALVEDGFTIFGVDASPRMVAAFHERFPHAQVACEPVEDSIFFGRTFDAALAVGLVFLLAPAAQRRFVHEVGRALVPGGRFLFAAPTQTGTWHDLITDRESVSLGDAAYREAIASAGLVVVGEAVDEGENHYYDVRRE